MRVAHPKTLFALLAAAAALAAAGSALVPAPAQAEVAEEGAGDAECLDWLDVLDVCEPEEEFGGEVIVIQADAPAPDLCPSRRACLPDYLGNGNRTRADLLENRRALANAQGKVWARLKQERLRERKEKELKENDLWEWVLGECKEALRDYSEVRIDWDYENGLDARVIRFFKPGTELEAANRAKRKWERHECELVLGRQLPPL